MGEISLMMSRIVDWRSRSVMDGLHTIVSDGRYVGLRDGDLDGLIEGYWYRVG